jgi:hypothetical protein
MLASPRMNVLSSGIHVFGPDYPMNKTPNSPSSANHPPELCSGSEGKLANNFVNGSLFEAVSPRCA